jgi:ABC-type Fe3+ transport system permease subunit
LPAVILVGVWAGMPQTTIALLAGLQSIQDELHEAAASTARPRGSASARSRCRSCAR